MEGCSTGMGLVEGVEMEPGMVPCMELVMEAPRPSEFRSGEGCRKEGGA